MVQREVASARQGNRKEYFVYTVSQFAEEGRRVTGLKMGEEDLATLYINEEQGRGLGDDPQVSAFGNERFE